MKFVKHSLSSGERKGKSPNPALAGGCKEIVSGAFQSHWNALEGEHLDKVWLREIPWKGIP